MQPTGDLWGDSPQSRAKHGEHRGAYIDRICGSAWIGREVVEHLYDGQGPLWPEFYHMFVDEHLQCVAEKLGILWQRRDLTQHHEHWAREGGKTREDCPDFLKQVTSPEHWAEAQAIFNRLKAGGFAEGHIKKARFNHGNA
jgi:hypothetical protein